MHDQNMLEIKNIYKNFGSLKVLKGVSTKVDKGEVISIIGSSGSGKSTLLRCMNLLEEPTFGEVWIEGKLMTPVDPYLHYDVIRASNTYKKLLTAGMADMDAINKIKSEDLLQEKHSKEGQEYKALHGRYPDGQQRPWEEAEAVRQRVIGVLKRYAACGKVIVAGHGMMIQAAAGCAHPENGQIVPFALPEE